MPITTMAEAIREAARSERAGARFYRALAGSTAHEDARAFLAVMAEEEEEHAQALEELGQALAGGSWTPNRAPEPGWVAPWVPGEGEDQGLTLEEAVEIALEAEQHAAALYGTLSEATDGKVSRFFRSLALNEGQHAMLLERMLNGLLDRAERAEQAEGAG